MLAVNKIDLVEFSQQTFGRIVADWTEFASGLGLGTAVSIPVSARFGHNVTRTSNEMPWYQGPTLLEHLETVDVEAEAAERPFRFPVQRVNRPNPDFRGFSGTVASGRIAVGDAVVVAASGRQSRIARILGTESDQDMASAGQAVTLCLSDEIDVARGDVLAPPKDRPEVSDQFAAHVLWMDDKPLLAGRQYQMRVGNLWTTASITSIRHRIDVNTLERQVARQIS